MTKAHLKKRKLYTPIGKPDEYTYDLYVDKKCRTRGMSYDMGMKHVKKLNKS